VDFTITKTKLIAAGAAVLLLVGGTLVLFQQLFTYRILLPPPSPTRTAIRRLEVGLAGFYGDFGDYPPSDKDHMAARPYGYQNLAFYLCGPNGTGWGGRAGGSMPFGGSSSEIFGPYFERDDSGSEKDPAEGIRDAFRPPMPILYFRAEPTEEPMFDAADNPLDPTGREGFASQEHFEMLARRADGKWVRSDFLLISAGPDRLFGYVIEDKASSGLRPARPDEKEKAYCDDIVNFKY